ncbi:UbiA family prenyltransferase [Natronorubrum sp. FCH18a]|uniref:UbiA family prenyltransferase n=1 Tax=Natronorubrum sp. FCH18a TaxID=3447018 RepID=UPI003F512E18
MPGPEADSVEERTADGGSRSSIAAYAQLVRVPNLFTAPPDVILGAALLSAAGLEPRPASVAGLAVASVLLYAGGTTLNDAFDAPVDARERPERPVPSGRVSRDSAFTIGFGLLLLGIVGAFVATGGPGAVVAGLIAAAIVAYDGALKGTSAGFLAMGTTRGLNVVLGTTAAGFVVLELALATVVVPAAVVVYIAAVTSMAARETEGGNRGAVGVAIGGVVAALVVLAWYLASVRPTPFGTVAAVAFAGAFVRWVGRPLRSAYADPVPGTVGPAVGACVLGLVLLDAAFAAAAGPGWAVAAGVFLAPAVVLSRAFDVT